MPITLLLRVIAPARPPVRPTGITVPPLDGTGVIGRRVDLLLGQVVA